MKFTINIDEEQIAEIVSESIAKQILTESNYTNREAKYVVREGVDKAIKAYIYKEKDNIIERVVERATVEIVKKGLPKLLENLERSCRNEKSNFR